jgi:sugar lactone lactonase YvrE
LLVDYGNGAGGFTENSLTFSIPGTDSNDNASFLPADFDVDGDIDLLVLTGGNYDGTVGKTAYWRNNGNLTFTAKPNSSGTAVVTVTLNDSAGASSQSQTFDIVISKPHKFHNSADTVASGRNGRDTTGSSLPRPDGFIVAGDVLGPNGLCFSPDEKLLYVVESRGAPNRKILAYDLAADGKTLSNKRVLIDAGPGTPDGMRCDSDGNLWCGWGMGTPELDGVMIFAPDGVPIGRIALPERCANVCFGGPKRDHLFMTATQSLYMLCTNIQGAAPG